MDYYDLLLFLHLFGSTAMFAGWAIEFRVIAGKHGSSAADRAALLGPAGMTIAFLTGLAMMVWRWGPQPFMPVAIGGVVLLVAVGIGAQIAMRKGPANPARRARIGIASLGARVGVGLSLLAIMTAKPEMAASVALLVFGLLAGTLAARVLAERRGAESLQPRSDFR